MRLYSRVILADALPGAFCPGVTFRLYSMLATVKDLSASQATLDPRPGPNEFDAHGVYLLYKIGAASRL